MRSSGNPDLVEALGIEIKARRLELGLTQEALAGRAELDRPYISLIEIGRKQPTISVLYSLAIALELPFASFAQRIDERFQKSLRAKKRQRAQGSKI